MSDSFAHGYALLIGVGKTAHPGWSLPATAKDARAIREMLTDPNLCAYSNDTQHVRLLHDSGATRAAIFKEMEWLKTEARADPDATVIVYYSGHGGLSNKGYYLFPHDANPKDVLHTTLNVEEFTKALREIPARRLLAIMDCCHAEAMATSKTTPASRKLTADFAPRAIPKGVASQLKKGEGRAVFSSSRGAQFSWICPDDSLSVYTYHLLEALHGAGNKPGDTQIRLSNLMNYLGVAVPASAQKLFGEEQTPFFDTATEDFPVAVLRGGKGLPAGEWGRIQAETQENIRHVVVNISAPATGERGVTIGGSVRDSTIITGDENVVQRGKYNVKIDQARGLAIGDNARVDSDDDG